MSTDRVILFFTCLVVCGVAGIIIYATVNPNQDEFLVPDVVKPPNPLDPKYGSTTSAP
jgi:SNARE protein